MSTRPTINPNPTRRRAKPSGKGLVVTCVDDASSSGKPEVAVPQPPPNLVALPGLAASSSPIVLNLVLPSVPEGCKASVRITTGGIDVTVERVRVGYTIEEACELIPGAPHPQTLRAHLEKNGIAIGQCGRAPLISYEQLFAALRLTA